MISNIVNIRNLFLKLKSKFGVDHVLLTSHKNSPKKLALTVVKKQQLPDIGNIDSEKKENFLPQMDNG